MSDAPTPTPPPQPTPPPEPTSPPPTPSAAGGPTPADSSTYTRPQTFRVNGAEVSDFSAVQAHISALETFRSETIESARTGFVSQLATDGKIGNPQVESFQALAKGMTDEQFSQFKTGWDQAPKLAVFGQHPGNEGESVDPNNVNPELAELETVAEIVENHRRRGASQEEIAELASFKRLQVLQTKYQKS